MDKLVVAMIAIEMISALLDVGVRIMFLEQLAAFASRLVPRGEGLHARYM